MKKYAFVVGAMAMIASAANAAPVYGATTPSTSEPSQVSAPTVKTPAIPHVEYNAFKSTDDTKDILTTAQTYVQLSKQLDEAQRKSASLKDQSVEDKVKAFKKKLAVESISVDSGIIRSTYADKNKENTWAQQIQEYKDSLRISEPEFNQGTRQILSQASQDNSQAERETDTSETEAEKSARNLKELSTKFADIEKKFAGESADLNKKSLGKDFQNTAVPQQALNKAMADQWNTYIDTLNKNKVKLPKQAEFDQKDFFDTHKNLAPYQDANKRIVPHVAVLKDSPETLVLPQETMDNVARQFSELDKKYDPKGDGKNDAWSCSNLTSLSYGSPLSLNQMWDNSSKVDTLSRIPGDTVFMGTKNDGITNVGTYVGSGLMISSTATDKHVSVGTPENVYQYKRLSTVKDKNNPMPKKSARAWNHECGAVVSGAKDAPGWREWTSPLHDGSYKLGEKYESTEGKWSVAHPSPGLTFEPKKSDKKKPNSDDNLVHVSADGVVTKVKKNKNLGTTITVTHKNNSETSYSFLYNTFVVVGEKVYQKDVIGSVGKSGKQAEKDHDSVLLSMKMSGESVDPERMLFPENFAQKEEVTTPETSSPSASSSSSPSASALPDSTEYDGYSNGELPDSALCSIPQEDHRLRCDVVPSFIAMNAAYKAQFGKDMCVTDSYRSYAEQVSVKARKPGLAATPGKSNHGWGLAVDFCDGIQSFGTPQHEWMQQNANKFSWWHPDWAEPNGSKPEAWHWESFMSKKVKK